MCSLPIEIGNAISAMFKPGRISYALDRAKIEGEIDVKRIVRRRKAERIRMRVALCG